MKMILGLGVLFIISLFPWGKKLNLGILCWFQKTNKQTKTVFVKSHLPSVCQFSPIFLHRDNCLANEFRDHYFQANTKNWMPQHKIPFHEAVCRTPGIFPLNSTLLASITSLPKCLQIKHTQGFQSSQLDTMSSLIQSRISLIFHDFSTRKHHNVVERALKSHESRFKFLGK